VGPVTAAGRLTHAERASGPVHVDGALDEAAWAAAPVEDGFWQRQPVEGAPPQFRTEFRVLYDDHALYVGVRAYDPDPHRIRGILTRRDEVSSSDWLAIGVDSYFDRRTAFTFWINPAGVQCDMMVFDDTQEDWSWDAVWQAGTRVDDQGWTAEFRIPYNQLRFPRASEQRWGLQVQRIVDRTKEQTLWTPTPAGVDRLVSQFGEVRGLRDIPPSRRIELLPYATGGGRLASVDAGDPFHDTAEPTANLGIDFKYGLTSNLTAAGTINPDFGQVEADPSEVNLTAQETFFAEKRPFFVDGAEIFRFGLSQGDGDEAVEQLFYTRRIGAPPHETGADYADFYEEDAQTQIYGAAKMSGKTAGGVSMGAMTALTAEERSRVDDGAGNQQDIVIEPLTSYSVLRLKKDANAGRTQFGAVGTAVQRALGDTGLGPLLHDRAFSGGLEFRHRSPDDTWVLDGKLVGSYVHGSAAAIDETQRASQHYFQRPDGHVDYEPTRTHLEGLAFMGAISRMNSRHWRGAIGWDSRSPAFEVNDLGFERQADYVVNWLWLQRRDDVAGPRLQQWQVNLNTWAVNNWAPQFLHAGGNANFSATFRNWWSVNAGLGGDVRRRDVLLLRGGPGVRGMNTINSWASINSDGRERLSGSINASVDLVPESSSWSQRLSFNLNLQARSNLSIGLGPFVQLRAEALQYVDEVADGAGTPHYILARIDQRVVGLTARVNYTMSPRLSLQIYAQPFLASGAYRNYKEPADYQSTSYRDRWRELLDTELSEMDDVISVDRDGDGVADYSFDRPDFNFQELRSNVVLRWEYRPGSTLFLIWSHERAADTTDGRFRFGHDLSDLAHTTGEHVILAKLTYWWAQ
ncbi:MAG TPA: DUF5916 domain-containing protein, partial [Kofleriaceae bacterium]|nr:DUF5916 domain-containing protein [Kofleriaceae bacterium]